jgi:hypothetical protein
MYTYVKLPLSSHRSFDEAATQLFMSRARIISLRSEDAARCSDLRCEKHGWHAGGKEMCKITRFSIPADKFPALIGSELLDNERRTNFYLIKMYCKPLYDFLEWLGIMRPISVKDYVFHAKQISDMFKLYAEQIDMKFGFPPRYIYNLEQMVGHFSKELVDFDPDQEASKFMLKSFRNWNSNLLEAIEEYTEEVYAPLEPKPFKFSDFGRFLEEGEYWRRPASTTVSSVRSKMLLPEIGSAMDILKKIKLKENNLDSKVTPVTKLEKSKVRLAFSVDTYLYLLMSYVYDPLLNYNIPDSSIALNGKQEEAMLRKIQTYTNGDYYLVPFDFEKFDHNVTKVETICIMKKMYKMIKRMKINLPPDYDTIYNEMLDRYSKLEYVGRSGKIKYNNGLLSGLRLTAEIGTILNKAWHRYVLKKYNIMQFCVKIFAQGDDSLLVFTSRAAAIQHNLNMKREGFKCNFRKFYISKYRCEFLRREISMNGIFQYPLRMIGSISQRKPWKMDNLDEIEKVQGVLSNRRELSKRFNIYNREIESNIIQEVQRILKNNGWSMKKIKRMITSFVNPFGYSFGRLNTNICQYKFDVRDESRFVSNLIKKAGGQFREVEWANVKRKVCYLKERYTDNKHISEFISKNEPRIKALYQDPVIKSIRSEFSKEYIERYSEYKSKKISVTPIISINYNEIDNILRNYEISDEESLIGSGNKYYAQDAQFMALFYSCSPVRHWCSTGEFGNKILNLSKKIGKQAALSIVFDQFSKTKSFLRSISPDSRIIERMVLGEIERIIYKAPQMIRSTADLSYLYSYLYNIYH